jgi:hypothetical protein
MPSDHRIKETLKNDSEQVDQEREEITRRKHEVQGKLGIKRETLTTSTFNDGKWIFLE